MKRVVYLLFVLLMIAPCTVSGQNFKIADGAFLLNEKPVQLICGEMHYPRIPHEYWRDRIQRAKAMGINTISTYVFWNYHERQPGVFDFSGQADLGKFIKIAQEEGMFVILRPGPYVCAEWDFGGYPAWLQQNREMVYRSNDDAFLAACERYITRLGNELATLTVTNGGPIVMVQVENEYGSYGADKVYLGKLRDMIRKAGFNVPLMTCDGGGQMKAGQVDGTLATINGVVGEDILKTVDKYHPGGPYFVAEFYPAWFDVWGKPHSKRDYKKPAEQLAWMLRNKVSVSMYMFHGGTNFDYTNGANTAYGYAPQPTSYDYDAPLGEYGNITPKYLAFRDVIQRSLPAGQVLPDVPAENPVISFPSITLTQTAPLSAAYNRRISSERLLTMEDVNQDFGYIHYETTIQISTKGALVLKELRDYAVVRINGKQVASLDRRHRQSKVEIDIQQVPARLEILVENVGRVNYGDDILNNRKGITEKVMLNGQELTGWTVTPLPLYNAPVSRFKWTDKPTDGQPAFYKGTFKLTKTGDCFIDTRGWGKGAVWVNGRSLGKFWQIGPQQTLYLPAPWLKKGQNEIVVFAMEETAQRTIQGLDSPILDQVEKDKNAPERTERNNSRAPILDRGDCFYTAQLEQKSGEQRFLFDNTITLRHLCFESLSSFDGKYSCLNEINLIGPDGKLLTKDLWQVLYASTEQSGDGYADHLIDGNLGTYWHSQKENNAAPFPHRVIIDLGEIGTVKGIEIRQRSPKQEGCVQQFALYGRPQFFLFKNQ